VRKLPDGVIPGATRRPTKIGFSGETALTGKNSLRRKPAGASFEVGAKKEQKEMIEAAGKRQIFSYNHTDFEKERIAVELQLGKILLRRP